METNQPEVNPQVENSTSTQREVFVNKYSNPKKNGQYSLGLGIVSLFIFPFLSTIACIIGVFGLYYAIKTKAGYKIVLLNIAGILVGFTSSILSKLS